MADSITSFKNNLLATTDPGSVPCPVRGVTGKKKMMKIIMMIDDDYDDNYDDDYDYDDYDYDNDDGLIHKLCNENQDKRDITTQLDENGRKEHTFWSSSLHPR